MAREIKLNGRETAVLRTIGFGLGISGTELKERMKMDDDDLVDILCAMLEIGYLETPSMKDTVTKADFIAETYEVNPGYVTDLKEALKRR
jgi:hypothetical protein